MRIFVCLFVILAAVSNAQVLEQYPGNQVPYKGGYKAYYKDFKDIILKENSQPCANKSEFYQLNLLINAD